MRKTIWQVGLVSAGVEILMRIGLYTTGLTAPTYWPLDYVLALVLGGGMAVALDNEASFFGQTGQWNFRTAFQSAVATAFFTYALVVIHLFLYHGFISSEPLRQYIAGQVNLILANPGDPTGELAVNQMVLVMNSWEGFVVVLLKGWGVLLLPSAFGAWLSAVVRSLPRPLRVKTPVAALKK